MPVEGNQIVVVPMPEVEPRERQRLGRHQELDGRSLAYALSPAEISRIKVKPVEWIPPILTLDQGNLGSCVGNASTYHLAELVGHDRLAQTVLDGTALAAGADNEQFAVDFYHGATVKDGFPGVYPPEDTGSSGLGACRFAKSAGLITSYRHALSARAFGAMMMQHGAITGWPWYNAWFEPGTDGFIDEKPWERSGLAGGHEIYAEAIEQWDDADLDNCIVRFHNSWGSSWGDYGRFRMRLSTYERLKSQVDIKQFSLSA